MSLTLVGSGPVGTGGNNTRSVIGRRGNRSRRVGQRGGSGVGGGPRHGGDCYGTRRLVGVVACLAAVGYIGDVAAVGISHSVGHRLDPGKG